MIVVNTIHTFVLLRDGNLILRGWKNGERWEKMRETGDKGKKGEKGERKEKSGRRLPHVIPLIDSGTTFVLLRDGNLIFWWPSVIHV
jgi:hypothetical protein